MTHRMADITDHINRVLKDYQGIHFTPAMDTTAKAFLDLALEYQGIDDFCLLSVLILKTVMGWEAAVYIGENGGRAVMKASSDPRIMKRLENGEKIILGAIQDSRTDNGEHRLPLVHRIPESFLEELDIPASVGILAIRPENPLDGQEVLFLQKYARLIGISAVHRLIARKNIQHINFIKNLVADIGHNVIVPNIFFKAYLRRLSGKIDRLEEVQRQIQAMSKRPAHPGMATLSDLGEEMANANEGLLEEFDHIQKHYLNTSLFLETLLRQGHFEQGQYVLKKRPCNFRQDIILPQIERYRHRLKERGIIYDTAAGGVPDEAIEAVVDVGLVSQVYSNLLSNAIKYTRPVSLDGKRQKYINHRLEVIPNAFGPEKDGIKLSLFSSGKPLPAEESEKIFEEGYRGGNVETERGTGHGLFFVKEVIELHGGYAGHEPEKKGNRFYFVLPKQDYTFKRRD